MMVNSSLIEAILREHDNPGSATTRQIREVYNSRSGEEPILQHSKEDEQFKAILIKTLETLPADEDDQPISYTVKLKDSDDRSTPTLKRRSIIKLPKGSKEESESDESSSDSEKPSTASSITITKPFSPLFVNNMKKFGVSTDWLAKRSNSLRQSAYSLSSVKSNTSRLDAMIKSASAKPIRSNRKLSFIESPTSSRVGEPDKENTDPSVEKKAEDEDEEVVNKPAPEPTPYDLSSEVDEDMSPSKEFSLRIPRVNLPEEEKKQLNFSSSSSSSSSSAEEIKKEKPKPKSQRKKRTTKSTEKVEQTPNEDEKKSSDTKDTNDRSQFRIDHLKKLLRLSGIRQVMKKSELEPFSSNKAKIAYLKSLFDTAGFTGNLSIKECEKFREKRDTEKELLEIQANAVDVQGHVKGGRTLRGQARPIDTDTNTKRKRTASSEVDSNGNSSEDDEKPIVKKRRVLKMEASPEVSDAD